MAQGFRPSNGGCLGKGIYVAASNKAFLLPVSSAGDWGHVGLCGSFHKLGVQFVGVLMIRVLLFDVYVRAPDFWKLPCRA